MTSYETENAIANDYPVDPDTGEVFEQTAELALANEGAALMHSVVVGSDQRIESYGFDTTTDEGMVRIFNAEEDGESLNEAKVTELDLVGVMLRPGTTKDPVTGAKSAAVNTTLFDVNGHNYVSQSIGIAKTAARIAQLMEQRGWPEGGRKVKVVEHKLDAKRTLKKLLLV